MVPPSRATGGPPILRLGPRGGQGRKGAGIASWLVCALLLTKVPGSSPCKSGIVSHLSSIFHSAVTRFSNLHYLFLTFS